MESGEKNMKNITVTDTLGLSISKRIQLVEDIWDTIAAQTESVELSEEDKQLIDNRLQAYHENPDLGSPWEEVYNRILSKK